VIYLHSFVQRVYDAGHLLAADPDPVDRERSNHQIN
jgi:hypothetical protein